MFHVLYYTIFSFIMYAFLTNIEKSISVMQK